LTIHDLSPLEHPEWFRKSFSKWYRLFLPILAKRVRVIFTPSEYTKRKVIQRFGVRNVIVTPNSVNPSCFHPGARHHIPEMPAKYILFVGSLQPRKNLHTLLVAWDEIKHQYPDLWLIIAGDGGSVFEKTELPSGERIRSMGYVDESDLPGLYAKATLFVLPSLDEGFGLPVLEAMACGTPVIASNGGALPATIDGAGLIFSASAPRSLSQVICECLENPALYASLVEKGLARVKEFSWERTAELVWKTLHEI
jgi:glycosyltransferase involved in cell wall biosynthesis